MKKQILFSLVLLILIVNVISAQLPSISTLPENIELECGNNYDKTFQLDGLNGSINSVIQGTGSNYRMALTPGANSLRVSFFQMGICSVGSSTFSFKLDEILYEIVLDITDTLLPLYNGLPFPLAVGQKFSIGNTVHFNLVNVGSNFVDYSLEGCGSSDETKLYVGSVLDKICGTERLEVKIAEILGSDSATFNISFSTQSLTLTKSDSDANDDTTPDTCILGIDTLGATVRRGSVFAFNTINTVTGKYEPSTIVNILDQSGDLTPLSGISDNTGFFQKRIHEDYKQDLLIKLFKDGCEPTNKVILFQNSYDDYKLAKGEEEGGFQLVLNMSARYQLGAISGTIKNILNEVIEGVEVKITQPDGSIITVQSGANGVFSWTPTATGTFSLQGGKDDYQSTDLVSIEVYQDKTYLIVIKVNGEQKAGYKSGDRINFELRDINNTLIPLTIDATFAGLPLRFISGISDTAQFGGTSVLDIPAVEGYLAQTITLTEKTTKMPKVLVWVVGIIMGLVVLIMIGAIIKKRGGKMGKPPQQMEIQMSEGGN